MSIAGNLETIAQNIRSALARRSTHIAEQLQPVTIIAVTKNQDIAAMREAIDHGVTIVGENRVQEAMTKHKSLDRTVEWHLIGHLQTNKVRQAVSLFDLIHSVDSERLAREIDRAAAKIGKRQNILLQVNVAGEETKFGVSPREAIVLARLVAGLEHVRLCGLMTIAPFFDDAEMTRPVFRELYQIYCELKALNLPGSDIKWLSMGMTNDYTVAVEEGANLVRIGTGIFGPRQYRGGGTQT
ncbi:alanine racemase domain protein [Thermosinus carboxydivorans Nor1]|uniref:Pyridoxal phosphate homeostasis protein n=1 Tax=Thermosinus carboxydivorans Nor1 TaxID=401526 RepID=A1HS99_9FIRM|nr:YggS family pyridoxal phosphate-dependent enzyme [Thermosinus carboxydivorans]EAX47061.1 alanine racemase domain protein [Thermosinus carboxydivorans Nor1]